MVLTSFGENVFMHMTHRPNFFGYITLMIFFLKGSHLETAETGMFPKLYSGFCKPCKFCFMDKFLGTVFVQCLAKVLSNLSNIFDHEDVG